MSEEGGSALIENLDCKGAELNRFKTLFALTKTILAVDDFQTVLNNLCFESAFFLNARGSVIRLLRDENLMLVAQSGLDVRIMQERKIGEGLCGQAVAKKITTFFNQKEAPDMTPSIEGIQVGMGTPLKIGDNVIGALVIVDKMDEQRNIIPFNDDDRIKIEDFASIAAIAIEKSMLLEKAIKQENEALRAQKQAETLRDYLQSLIKNSSDSVITTDLGGIVTSWNDASENMFGYSREEALGGFDPSVPNFLSEAEKHYLEQIMRGESIKDLETVRKTKDGGIMDVSLNMAPIKDSQDNILGVSRIGRDITERKRIEKDLMRKNNELSRLLFISSHMRGTLELDKLLRMVLTAVTMGDGLGFNRAMLFLVDDKAGIIRGAMGVGPANHDEAWEIWSRLSMENKDIHAIMEEIERSPMSKDSRMDRLCCGITVSLEEDTILTRAVKEKKSFNVTDVMAEPLSDAILIQQLGTMAYALLPLISMDRVIGILWVDNLFSRKIITGHDMDVLKGFTDQIASAIENARLFEKIARTEQELENIFESISDMMYINDSNYVIKRINRAVVDKIGKKPEEIIGRKCYETFHGLDSPWELCPHHKTIVTKKPYVEEVDDPNLGGTFLISSSPLFSKDGSLSGTVHIARDISEMKKLKDKFVAVERMAALGEMAAKVAHEIRNPLLSIGGFARRLEKKLQDDMRDQARIIVEEVRRLEGILNNTLSFVRSSVTERHEVMVTDLIDDIFTLLEPAINERGNVLIIDVEQPLLLMVNYDRLKEAILNLISNANIATQNGTIKIKVYSRSTFEEPDLLGYTAENREAVIEISDTGYGIKKEDLDRIFDPFFTTRPTGTGLGLSITKRIIEEHGGRIEVDSNIDNGAVFRIYIPLKGGSHEDTGGR
jgi:PAS domain S-box-containing protein